MSTDKEMIEADDPVCYQCDECGTIRHPTLILQYHNQPSCLECAINRDEGGRVGRFQPVHGLHHEPESPTLPQPKKGKRMIQV